MLCTCLSCPFAFFFFLCEPLFFFQRTATALHVTRGPRPSAVTKKEDGSVALKFFFQPRCSTCRPGTWRSRPRPSTCPPGTWRPGAPTWITLGTQLTSAEEDTANKFAPGHHPIGTSMLGFVLCRRRILADTCTGLNSLLLYTAYGESAGSGLGCLLRKSDSRQSVESCACTPRLSTRM